MALSIPSRKGVTDALRNYFRAELPNLDTSTERRSLIGALVKSLGSALADFYIALKRWVDREPFPQTASEAGTLYTGWWQALTKLERNPAAPAHGMVVITGTSGTAIPADLVLTAGSVTYKTKTTGTIVSQPIAAASLRVSYPYAEFTSNAPHLLASGVSVTISGAAPSGYNGTYTITVTGDKTFTYEPPVLPGSAASGSPVASITGVAIEVQSTSVGKSTNLDGGSTLSIAAPPVGASSTAYVCYDGVQGGTDIETADEYRARVLKALGTDYGMFTADEIEIIAKQVPGVTRVMIRKAMIDPPLGWPLEGQVKIAFLRDNDVNPLPTAQEVADVKSRIMALAMPAHTAPEDVIVMSPRPHRVDIILAGVTPDSASMRRAIKAQLEQFFRENATWGEPIDVIAIQCAIRDVVDVENRVRLKSFNLIAPNQTVVPGVDDIPILGSVIYT